MNLELRKVAIKDIQFGNEGKVVDGCLYVDPKRLEELVLEDSKVKGVLKQRKQSKIKNKDRVAANKAMSQQKTTVTNQ